MIYIIKNKQFIGFIIAGGIAAIINYGSRFFYSKIVSFDKAIVVAYITGMICAFILNKLFVFQKSIHSTRTEFMYFTLVNIVAIIQTYIISIGLVNYVFPKIHYLWYPEAVAHAIGVIFPVFTSYIGHKYFSFRKENY